MSQDVTDKSHSPDETEYAVNPQTGAIQIGTGRSMGVIYLLLISGFVMILNETMMSVALPNFVETLRISEQAGQWMTTSFLLTMAVVIPVTGFLIERLHTRTLYMAAMSAFFLGTALGALAPVLGNIGPEFGFAVAARVIQAMGTAVMMPLLMTTIMNLVPADRRGTFMGNVSIVIAVAPALGPSVAGTILSGFDWPALFIAMLPVALIMGIVGAILMVNLDEPANVRTDVLSIILAALGFGGLVYALNSVASIVTTGPTQVIVWGALSLASLGLFVARQLHLQRTTGALLDLRVFKHTQFARGVLLGSVSMLSMFGVITVLPLYLSRILAWEPLQLGLATLPGSLIMGLAAPFVGRLFDKRGPRVLVIPGAFVVLGALIMFTFLGTETSGAYVIAAHIVLSIGLALLFTPMFTNSLNALPHDLYPHGSATLSAIQQLMGAVGIAIFFTTLGIVERATGDAMAGFHAAFIAGAIAAVALVLVSFSIKRSVSPDGERAGAPVAH